MQFINLLNLSPGYCFSASVPPLLAAASIAALDIIEREPEMFSQLQQRCNWLHEELMNVSSEMKVRGHQNSPVKHLHLLHSSGDREKDEAKLDAIVNHVSFFY